VSAQIDRLVDQASSGFECTSKSTARHRLFLSALPSLETRTAFDWAIYVLSGDRLSGVTVDSIIRRHTVGGLKSR